MIDPVVIDYFRSQLTIIDYGIITLGIVLMVMQLFMALGTTRRRIHRNADRDSQAMTRTAIRLQIVSSMIELLPYLGILGTVFGLMSGLWVIQAHSDPTTKDIAAKLAPALSTTFFGLAFAIVNTFVFSFLAAHIAEIHADYVAQAEKAAAVAELLESPGGQT